MKTVKMLPALVLCFCAFSASAAIGSGIQPISTQVVASQGGIELAAWRSPHHGKYNTLRKHRERGASRHMYR